MEKVKIEPPSFYEAFCFWLLLGFISFGGPTGQIATMYRELVEKRKWISNDRFLHALNFCMFLPGPEATQLAIYIGWLLHGTWGGIMAGVLFIFPSVLIMWLLSLIYVLYGTLPWVSALFYGLKPAVVAIVALAVIQIGKKALKNRFMIFIAVSAFMAIFFLKAPFPLVILGAMGIGAFFSQEEVSSNDGESVIHDTLASSDHAKPTLKRGVQVLVWGLILWWLPVLLLGYFAGWDSVLFKLALFFSKVAVVTFGGAYAVLGFVADYAVHNSWIFPGQMIDGLGLAETTPGPLIMVLQFVGFLAGWHLPSRMSPYLSATLGAWVTTWTTFIPSFIFIFLGAPYIEKFRGNIRLTGSLSTVTAAVVGVVLNLAVWFGIQVLFVQQGHFDPIAFGVTFFVFIAMLFWNWDVIYVIFASGFFGFIYKWLIG